MLRRFAMASRQGIPRYRVGSAQWSVAVEQLRLLVAAFGDPGHAFPAIALARALRGAAMRCWSRRGSGGGRRSRARGSASPAAEEYTVFPPPGPDTPDGQTAADAALALLPLDGGVRAGSGGERHPHAGADARRGAGRGAAGDADPARLSGARAGDAVSSLGLRPPRTPVGRRAWRGAEPLLAMGLRRGRDEINETRAAVGSRRSSASTAGSASSWRWSRRSRSSSIRGGGRPHVHVTGPMQFELPYPDIELPEGDEPLVLVAPSTAQDPELRLVRAALEALAEEPVRVVATTNRHRPRAADRRRRRTRWWSTGSLLAGDAGGRRW